MLNEKIQIITNLTILVSTLFAILYFDPFGLKSKVKFEQYIQVRDFLSFLKELQLNILYTNNNGVLSFGLKDSIDILKDNKLMFLNNLLTMKILVKYSDYHFLLNKTKEFKNNLLTPNELKNKINVSLWLGGNNNETELGLLEVRFNINPEGKDEFGKLFLTKWDNNSCSFVTLEEFIDEYGSLINICENWLNSNKLS